MALTDASLIPALKNIATQLRIDSLKSTSEAGSGHPTSCCSAAELMAALFFAEMRFDPRDPHHPGSDRFVLSKGHAAPILYAAWAEAGAFDRAELLKLRRIGSDLEGHPTPRLPFVDVATGSLGQGICAAIGTALNARRIKSDYRTYVLLGDGESAEGSVWEAADVGRMDGLDNLCGITDVNALGQSRPTMWQHDMEQFARRWRAFGWHAIVIDGHDLDAILDALAEARRTKGRPTMILARTIKGKGVSFAEGKDGWHGRAFKKGEELDRALAELEQQFVPVPRRSGVNLAAQIPKPPASAPRRCRRAETGRAARLQAGRPGGDARSVRHRHRQARRSRSARRGARCRRQELDLQRQVREGGSRSLLPELHRRAGDGRRGDGARGARRDSVPVDVRVLPVARRRLHPHGRDQQRRHQDGRLARRRVDRRGRAVADGARGSRDVPGAAEHHGALSVRRRQRRAARGAGGVPSGSGLHPHQPAEDAGHLCQRRDVYDRRPEGAAPERRRRGDGRGGGRHGVRGAQGVRAAEGVGHAIRVIDLYSVAPVDRDALVAAGRATGGHLITVEDHYAAGGIGDAVAEAVADAGFTVHRLAVREIPRSGKPDELLDRFGISARHIVEAVRAVANSAAV